MLCANPSAQALLLAKEWHTHFRVDSIGLGMDTANGGSLGLLGHFVALRINMM